jgi:hypothetical protein
MLDFGWKKKAEFLRMTILSAGHQVAKELGPNVVKLLALFRRTAETGDGSMLQAEIDRLPPPSEETRLLWEPIEVHGWKIEATMYRKDDQLWWLVQAHTRNERVPRQNDVAFLDKVLAHLGADPKRDMVIGPSCTPPGEELLFFGWWTWRNTMPLYEIQAKGWGSKATMRVVPEGTPESDGFTRFKMSKDFPS